MTIAVFNFRFHPAFRVAALPFGVRSDTARVELSDAELRVHFGRWHVRTPLSNVESAGVTGPYAWPKVIGPPHLSLSDHGLTCATNPDAGVCIRLHRPVRGIDPWGAVRHPAVTVTVADTAALAELLDRRAQDDHRVHLDEAEPTIDDLVDAVHDDLRSLSAAELRRRARDRGIRGVSRRSKAELVAALEGLVPVPSVDGVGDG